MWHLSMHVVTPDHVPTVCLARRNRRDALQLWGSNAVQQRTLLAILQTVDVLAAMHSQIRQAAKERAI